jgi:hypothetical protein
VLSEDLAAIILLAGYTLDACFYEGTGLLGVDGYLDVEFVTACSVEDGF